MHDATDRPASHTREDVIESARILHELCVDRGLADSQACRPPGCGDPPCRVTDGISTHARNQAEKLRRGDFVHGVPATLERIADRHDKLLAMVREMQQQAAQTLRGDPQ